MTDFPSSPVTETLLPCPFCGGSNITSLKHLDWVACQDCGAALEDAEPSAHELWNTRAVAQTPAVPSREQIAKIIAPELYGSPMAYPSNIESDEDLNFYRNQALNQANAIRALSDTSTLSNTNSPEQDPQGLQNQSGINRSLSEGTPREGASISHQSAPLGTSSLPSGESDPSVTLDCGGADTCAVSSPTRETGK